MKDFRVFYDEQQDILYLAKAGREEQTVEIAPGLNAELDDAGQLIGIELFHASKMLGNAVKQMMKKIEAA